MSELTVREPPESPAATPPPPNPHFQPPKPHDEDLLPGAVEVRYVLDEGPVSLRWPDELSPESVEEFEYWVEGLIRRARRKAGLEVEKATSGSD